ncbi:hypothetical protein BH09BAC1_BH09BAC1_30660 [soil metagenome]
MKRQICMFIILSTLLSFHTVDAQNVVAVNNIASREVREISVAGGKLFFNITDSTFALSTWLTDGTDAGTLKFLPSGSIASISNCTESNGTIFCLLDDDNLGIELGKTDGTAAGTAVIKDIRPGAGSGNIYLSKLTINGKLLFMANDSVHGNELWVSDGTAAGTTLLKDIGAGTMNGMEGAYISRAVMFNGKVYFAGNDHAGGGYNVELWETDGTTAGTKLVKEINPTGSANFGYFQVYNGKLYFSATDGVNGIELWVTDGTAANTVMVKDILPGADGFDIRSFQVYNGQLLFAVADAGFASPTQNYSLWKTDGTAVGTVKILDTIGYSAIVYKNSLYYSKKYADGTYGLWKTDGTIAGNQWVADTDTGLGGNPIIGMTISGGRLYFNTRTNDGGAIFNWANIWVSDGTTSGTELLLPFEDNIGPVYTSKGLWDFAGHLYFVGRLATPKYQLLRTTSQSIGIEERRNTLDARIYPNPTNGAVNITVASSLISTVSIYNLQGQVVYKETLAGQTDSHVLNTTSLSPGLYMLHVASPNGGRAIQKLIVD